MLMSQEIQQMVNDLISQYGDDAKAIAMLRAAEYAASFNEAEWLISVSYTHLTLPTNREV